MTHENIYLLNQYTKNFPYQPIPKPIKTKIPDQDIQVHGNTLQRKFENIRKAANSKVAALSANNGTYIEFESEPEIKLALANLENKKRKIRLVNIKSKDNKEYATVFVPKGEESFFTNKINDYLDPSKVTSTGKPRHQKLLNCIHDIKLALAESFIPTNHRIVLENENKQWFELWINTLDDTNPQNAIEDFKKILAILNITFKPEVLYFPERAILIAKINKTDISNIISASPYLEEIRLAKTPNDFYLDEIDNTEQKEFTEDLLKRVNYDESSSIVINILDTGVNYIHPLLNNFITATDLVSYDPTWNKADRIIGHGTAMAGIALYDSLNKHLSSSNSIDVTHNLESSKILPDQGMNNPDLYGYITADVVSQQIINNPEKIRINCMAVTASKDGVLEDGRPSSWSSSIDSITFGTNDNIKKLFLISAGNVNENDWINYPNININSPVQDPAQSWNSISVGAYTLKDEPTLIPSQYINFQPIAKSGSLSPSSRTSLLWDSKWPIKPEIVMEGGNGVTDNSYSSSFDNYSELTTNNHITQKLYTTINSTSEATAHASWIAAQILNKNPNLWPETVRGLIIHSAEWTNQMLSEIQPITKKGDYLPLLKKYGYGVPNLNNILYSMDNNVNIISEREITPFKYEDKKVKLNEMHLFELPWPKEDLLRLNDKKVRLKITLSYFIDPSPGEKGWRDKYKYASHMLRFDLNGVLTKNEFLSKINKAMREKDISYSGISNGIDWRFGTNLQSKGSIHSDVWEGTAADLATSNLIAVFPVSGWWKEKEYLKKYNDSVRYSLIISLQTEENIDLYTPIINKIENPISLF
ncbi:S8 family peptidase [Lysinibacillus sphaericus]|uniref:S8 family peptidase n=1 Tax=Lysinibacillus sphaericus TaxID=1421 RepID=UPI001CBBA1C7|nr:S8 family peptidase [Lysinibacillus sphaericus]